MQEHYFYIVRFYVIQMFLQFFYFIFNEATSTINISFSANDLLTLTEAQGISFYEWVAFIVHKKRNYANILTLKLMRSTFPCKPQK